MIYTAFPGGIQSTRGRKWQLCLNIVVALPPKPPRLDCHVVVIDNAFYCCCVTMSLFSCHFWYFSTDSGGQKLLFAFQFVGDRFKFILDYRSLESSHWSTTTDNKSIFHKWDPKNMSHFETGLLTSFFMHVVTPMASGSQNTIQFFNRSSIQISTDF